MLDGRVVQHEVEHDAYASCMALCHEAVERLHVPGDRIDSVVIYDVVAEVLGRCAGNGREPDGVDAERSVCAVVEVVEPLDKASKVADAVTVAVLKAAEVD